MKFRVLRSAAIIALLTSIAVVSPAVGAADMNKVIRDVFPAGETGFDPVAGNDLYSGTIIQAIFDTLYTYGSPRNRCRRSPTTARRTRSS